MITLSKELDAWLGGKDHIECEGATLDRFGQTLLPLDHVAFAWISDQGPVIYLFGRVTYSQLVHPHLNGNVLIRPISRILRRHTISIKNTACIKMPVYPLQKEFSGLLARRNQLLVTVQDISVDGQKVRIKT